MVARVARQQVVNAVRDLPLFAGSTQEELDEVAAFSALRHIPRGQSLFSQNEPCVSLYRIDHGLVKLARYGARGGEQIIDIVGPGRLLGLTAMMAGNGYPFDAVAVDDSEILVVQAAPLMRFVGTRPERLLELAAELARRHEHMVARVEQIIGRTAVQRVALYLLESSAPPEDEPSPPPLAGVIRRADVANMLGLTPETFSRVLARFRHAGFIRDKCGVAEVTRPDLLGEVLQDPTLMRDRDQAVATRLAGVRPSPGQGMPPSA